MFRNNENYIYSGIENDCFFVSTPSGRVIFTASSLRSIIGYDLVGRNLNDFLPDEIAAQIIISSVHDDIYNFECDISDCHFKGKLDCDKSEIVVVLTPFSRVVSRGINKNTAQLISREINQNVSVLLGSMNLLDTTDETFDVLCSAKQNLFKLLRLSNNISDYSNYENGTLCMNFSSCDVVTFFRDIFIKIDRMFLDSPVTFEVQLPSEPIVCDIDKEKIERVIYNLISNSINSLKRSGTIVFALSSRDSFLHISIKDTGRGMGGEQVAIMSKKHVLQTATNVTSLGGAGFGFCLSQAFVEMHNGSILFFSMPNSGTTVNITIPINTSQTKTQFRNISVDYSGGYNIALLELSQVLPHSAYKKRENSDNY